MTTIGTLFVVRFAASAVGDQTATSTSTVACKKFADTCLSVQPRLHN